MNAIITAEGETAKMYALTQAYPAPLIPLVNRPFIQHVVEYLVGCGFQELDILLYNQPEQIESLLEDGTRWGCRIQFHLLRDTSLMGKTIKLIHEKSSLDLVLLADATTLPQVDLLRSMPATSAHSPVMFCADARSTPYPKGWTGWAWLSKKAMGHIPDRCTKQGLGTTLLEETFEGTMSIPVPGCIHITSYQGILDAHQSVLDKDFQGLIFTGKEVEEGIWLSRNVILHPTAKITPPVYIGRNCRIGKGVHLGPYVSIGRNCVVDAHSSVENAVVFPDTYVGESLDLNDVIVDRNRLVNARFDSEMHITDPFILSGMKDRQVRKWLSGVFSKVFAGILLMTTLPFFPFVAWHAGSLRSGRFLTKKKAVRLPAPHDPALWDVYDLLSFPPCDEQPTDKESSDTKGGDDLIRHFLLTFLPGLINVAKGDLQIVGVAPRSPEDVSLLEDEWSETYLRSKAGLITEAIINFGTSPSPFELYSAEMLYSKTFSRMGDLILIGKYFRLVFSALGKKGYYRI